MSGRRKRIEVPEVERLLSGGFAFVRLSLKGAMTLAWQEAQCAAYEKRRPRPLPPLVLEGPVPAGDFIHLFSAFETVRVEAAS